MSLAHESDTIAAIATPIGEGGISVIRISGANAIKIADRGFKGKTLLEAAGSHTAHHGRFTNKTNDVLDDVVALVFKGPNSYTGEDTVELSCHGGMFVTKKILETIIEYGTRTALPGEFTKRAFLNGKLDLAQAEAIADLIHARSEVAHRSSLQQLSGSLSERIKAVRDQLVDTIGLLELELDFAEDGFEFLDKSRVAKQIENAISQIDELLSSYSVGKIYRDGVRVVLAGAPNVGKSSLLNALLKENRAIVTDIPGTTRDTIEETITIDGLMFNLTDTAGLRETTDPVEREGVRRTDERIANCDLLLLMFDLSRQLTNDEHMQAEELIERVKQGGAAPVLVLNKMDIKNQTNGFFQKETKLSVLPVAKISAKTTEGLSELKRLIVQTALHGKKAVSESGITITNARHYSSLLKASESLKLSLGSLTNKQSGEFIAVDLRAALDSLGEIIGVVTTDDILNRVFSTFCIGK